MKVQTATQLQSPLPTLGQVCRRGSAKILGNGRITMREDRSHIVLEVNTHDLDIGRLYVWIKQGYVLILGRQVIDAKTRKTQSFVQTIQLPCSVEGSRAVIEKQRANLHIVAPKMGM